MAARARWRRRDQLLETAEAVKSAGATICAAARSAAHEPYSFQGLGWKRCAISPRRASRRPAGVTEGGTQPGDIVQEYADILRSHPEHAELLLLTAVGRTQRPSAQARYGATIESADGRGVHRQLGQPQRDLCERGIRTFETYTANTMDVSLCRWSTTSAT